jgi:membrane dipeptidase
LRAAAYARAVIVDAHNDLLLELVIRHRDENPFRERWLPKLRAGGVALQVCPIYAADVRPAEAPTKARAQVEQFERLLRENADDVFHVRTRADLAQVGRDDRIGLMLSLEGVECVQEGFDEWWYSGVRMVGLTWNRSNWAAGGIDDPEQGLTHAGAELVGELVERGVILDLAHASPAAFDETVERAQHVVCSHACCRALVDIPRNLSDEQLAALGARGGVLGVMALALVVGYESATIERLLDHLDHAVSVMGIGGVGLGADVIDQVTDAELEAGERLEDVVEEALARGGGRMGLRDFTGPEHYPALVNGLRERGYDGEWLDAITHANFLRVFRAALPS